MRTRCSFHFSPGPNCCFASVIVWAAVAMAFWYSYAGDLIGSSAQPVIGVAMFLSARELWFDLYFAICVAIFAGAWMVFSPHPSALWSILGSALILFTSYFQVEVSVAINGWIGPFYDLLQAVAPALKISLSPLAARDSSDIERLIGQFARPWRRNYRPAGRLQHRESGDDHRRRSARAPDGDFSLRHYISSWRAYLIRPGDDRLLQSRRPRTLTASSRAQNPRPAGAGSDNVRFDHQSKDRQGPWLDGAADIARPG